MNIPQVLLFPGQGSQAPGMGQWMYNEFATAKRVFEEGSDALGVDLKKLIFEGSTEDLALTENTQPALLCVSTAAQKVLRENTETNIQAAAGHSVGEYAALVAAEAISYSDAMKAVRFRGQAMQSAVPVGEGGMVATLNLDDLQVQWLCDFAMKNSGHSPVSPANFNSPGQVVISGNQKALSWLIANLKPEEIPGSPKRVRTIPLAVSAPFHCQMMEPAEKQMREFLNKISFKTAKFPIIQNFVADFVSDANQLRENLVRQVSAPVLWTQSMMKLKAKGLTVCVECGHGSVVKGLLKKIDESIIVHGFNSVEELKSLIKTS